MARRLARLITLSFCLTPALALALGVGGIETRSALNEPLDARIPLLPDGVDELETVSMRLAPTEAFQRVGLDRPFLLSRLNFTVVEDGPGAPYVAVTTDDPVREPFLAFLVEVRWSGGRLLREYTLLLDPPLHEPREAPEPRMAAEPEPAPEPATAPARPARQEVTAAEPDPEMDAVREYGPVERNQTLWDIAMETRPDSSVSVHQMMMALLRANPEAFAEGNVNNLRAGAILRVPERGDIESLGVADARREFARQTEEWEAGRTPRPAEPEPAEDEMLAAEAVREEEAPGDDGRLQVVAAGDAGGDDPTATLDDDLAQARDPEVERLESELVALRESEASMRSEADELRQMNQELRERVEALERLVNLQADPSLVAGSEDESADDAPALADAPSEDEAADDDAPAVAAVEPPAAEGGAADSATGGDPAAAQPDVPAEEPFSAAAAVEPWEDPRVLAGAGGAGALLLLLLLLMLRRRRQSAQQEELEPLMAAGGGGAAVAGGLGGATMEAGQGAGVMTAAEAVPVRDPLEEADMYMGHGRYDQARDVVQRGLAVNPDDKQLRLKLLEIHALGHDRAAFESEAQDLYALVDGEEDPVWQRAAGMGREIAPEHPLFPVNRPEGGETGDSEADSAMDFLDDTFDLDLELDSETEDRAEVAGAAQPQPLDAEHEPPREPHSRQTPEDEDAPMDMESMEDDLSDLEFALDDDPDHEVAERDSDEPSRYEAESAAQESVPGEADDDPAAEDDWTLDFDLTGLDEEIRSMEATGTSADSEETASDDSGLDFDLDVIGDTDRPAASEVTGSGEDRRDAGGDTVDDEATGHDTSGLEELMFALDGDQERTHTQEGDAGSDDTSPAEDAESGGGADTLDDDSLFAGADENSTKLDLARAYLDMGDSDGARSLLEEVLEEGSDEQKREAEELLGQSA